MSFISAPINLKEIISSIADVGQKLFKKKELKKYDILLIMTNKNSERLWKPIIEYIQ